MSKRPDQGDEQSSQKSKPGKQSKQPISYPIVGLGASAGGLKALLEFFEQMPAESGMSFVVILHLSPKHESNVAAVLQNVTRMPVMQVTEPIKIQPNHVYVIPPNKDLEMSDGMLQPSEAERLRGRHIAIDLFFRTLADTHKERAICVILSGTGSDGTVGLTRIKEMGGVTIAQLPEDAEYDSMPRNAIGTGMVDFVLPTVEIPQRILQLWENAHRIELPPMQDMPEPAKVRPTAGEAQDVEEALRDTLTLLRMHPDMTLRITNAPPCCAGLSAGCRSITCRPSHNTAITCANILKKRGAC
jgi:two-component system CheB/CheR fusion protein